VLVKDDDTLVMGGFISDGQNSGESRVPYLGRIPLLGELFRTRNKSNEKRVLMIFVHPKILRTDEDSETITNAKYDLMRDQQKTLNRETTVAPLINMKGAKQLPEKRASGDGSAGSATAPATP
jgi:general secretion pathway protein D